MGKKKARIIQADQSTTIAEKADSVLALPFVSVEERPDDQPLRLKLLEIEQARQIKVLGNQQLMQVLGFIVAVVSILSGSLIIVFDRDVTGAIAGFGLGLMGILSFLIIQIRLLMLTQNLTN